MEFTKEIAEGHKARFFEVIESLNKKLAKIGKTPIEVEEVRRYNRNVEFILHVSGYSHLEDIREWRPVAFIEYRVTAEVPKFAHDNKEYIYLGSVVNEDGVKTCHITNMDYAEEFKKDRDICDHCHTHRKRKGYILFLEPESGRILWIGSKCSREYFGHDIERETSIWLDTYTVFSEDGIDGCSEDYSHSVSVPYNVLYNKLNELTNNFQNWTPTSDADFSFPTSWALKKELLETFDWDRKEVESDVTEQEVKGYWEAQEADSEFVFNVKNWFQSEAYTEANIGMIGYAIFKAVVETRKDRAIEKMNGQRTGCPYKEGERVSLEGDVIFRRSFEGMYGIKYLIKFLADNTLYTTFSTSYTAHDIKIGDKVKVKATIDGRDDYKGEISTRLKRCKFEVINEN